MASSEPGFGDRFTLTLVTDDPAMAAEADAAGVQRIGVDIERMGKARRQGHQPEARISPHTLDDLGRLAPSLRSARLFCRLDPPHEGASEQIERALGLGAQVLMLPYFSETADAERFVDRVAGRAETVLLVETAAAAWRIESLVALEALDEVMVGLNDLSWSLGIGDRFGLLASPLMLALSAVARRAGKRFSVGGLGRWDDSGLKTSPDLIYAQYPRLGANGAWLARSFHHRSGRFDWGGEVRSLRRRLDHWAAQDEDGLEAARRRLAEIEA